MDDTSHSAPPAPTAGDHLVSPRLIYSHHGLYAGDGQVIHYAGFNVPGVRGKVEQIPLEAFAAGRGWTLRSHPDRVFSPVDSVARARRRLGEDFYCVAGNNCEHFVCWCITGKHRSPQVERAGHGMNAAVAGLGGTGAVVAVAEVGVVAGLSASGMTSGLAAVGSVVGGGMAVGLAVVSAAPAAASVLVLNNTVLKDNLGLEPAEREARRAGRRGTWAGATGAVAGGIAAVGTLGTAGFSAAGITSGLAAIGSATGAGAALSALGVGGGMMVGGVVAVVAAPALAAAAMGVGVYAGARWWESRPPPGSEPGPVQPTPLPPSGPEHPSLEPPPA